MNKNTLKQIILAINESSLESQSREELIHRVKEKTQLARTTILQAIDILYQHKALEWLQEEVDLFPCAVIFARSKPNSITEILSYWQMFHTDASFWRNNGFEIKDKKILYYIEQMEKEDPEKIVSDTLSILYTDSIIHKSKYIPYKNEDQTIVPLKNRDFLYNVMPKKGIPTNRDISKDLQVYFKDTLMHEFDRTCPICGIHMPHMLIASHIKPFRDCAHIFEAADHNNGLLLCRNHDFLFDQGYISYQDDGTLIISKHLKHPEHYNLKDLNSKYMSENRKLYMNYHRKHIFQD